MALLNSCGNSLVQVSSPTNTCNAARDIHCPARAQQTAVRDAAQLLCEWHRQCWLSKCGEYQTLALAMELPQQAVFLESTSTEASADVEEGRQASSEDGLHR